MNTEYTYKGIKKCILNDYPYDIMWDDREMFPLFNTCYEDILEQHSHINNPYYSNDLGGIIRLDYLDHYVIMCFRFARMLNDAGFKKQAEAAYCSSRIRGSIDLFYTTEMGKCFMPVHALGTIVDSHSKYGDFFKIYDNCHIGPYSIVGKAPSAWIHPIFGNYVTILGHSKVFGNTIVGNNVIISAGSLVINEDIPDNCVVSGSSPNLVFQKLKVSNTIIYK